MTKQNNVVSKATGARSKGASVFKGSQCGLEGDSQDRTASDLPTPISRLRSPDSDLPTLINPGLSTSPN
ncbi:MAG: hypothetical protein F6K44_03545 [Moorea sp. SIO3E2]|uniref:hypothetical protein n=1 Tax=Moorena sp. SIO4E2 TaxID=2607826 RepID=UPI0013BAF79C|nr:hypothetical protein [Moorena sp. SIO4E2]NEQ05729.1 hypothetical protein [Moorena sp. SIO4E2]NEQ12998.1 hypothetical protein [Moorena sp. SIO3E2]